MPYRHRDALTNLSVNISGTVPQLNRLMANENPNGCSPNVKDALVQTLMNGPSNYPDGYSSELRTEIVKKYGVDKDEILFGNGTDEIIYMLGKAFLEPGDEVVMPALSFISYIESTHSMGAKMVYAQMKEDFSVDLDAILSAITDKTKYIVIVNPNNPTGTVFTEEVQRDFLSKVPKNVIVIMDEAYAEFYEGENYPNTYDMLKEYDNLIILKTFSKVYGLASFRIGFMVASKELITTVSRVKNVFNVSAQAMAAAVAAIRDTDFAQMVVEKNTACRDYLGEQVDKMGYRYIPSHTSFMLIDVRTDCKPVVAALREKGYLVRPGSDFGLDNFIRVSMGTMEQMQGFVKAFKEVMQT